MISLFVFILALVLLSYASKAPVSGQKPTRNHQYHATTPPPAYHTVMGMGKKDRISTWRDRIFKHCALALQPIGEERDTIKNFVEEIKPCDLNLVDFAQTTAFQNFSKWVEKLEVPAQVRFASQPSRTAKHDLSEFLLYCVARDCGVEHLCLRLNSQSAWYVRLYNLYEWSWMLQLVFGWKDIDINLHTRVYNLIQYNLELPAQQIGVPLSRCLWHLKVNESMTKLTSGSSSTELPANFRGSTLQAMRHCSRWTKLEELLDINEEILDKVEESVNPQHYGLILICRSQIKSERDTNAPYFSHLYHTRTYGAWDRFLSIRLKPVPNFTPLKKQTQIDENDENRRQRLSKVLPARRSKYRA